MLTRRAFLFGAAATTAALPTFLSCAVSAPPGPLPSVANDASLDEIIEKGITLLQNQDYPTAREYFNQYRWKTALPATCPEPSLDFLYAMSHVPDGSLWNGQIAAAGENLTRLLYIIRANPALLETMQQNLKPFFALEDYPTYKKIFRDKLPGRYQMLYMVVCLAEEDYAEAEQALKQAYRRLRNDAHNNEQEKVIKTLEALSQRARENGQEFRADAYDTMIANTIAPNFNNRIK